MIRRLAEQLGVHHEAHRNWIRQAEADAGERADRPTTDIAEENRRLRKENADLRRANEILKAASAYFVAELDRRYGPASEHRHVTIDTSASIRRRVADHRG